MSFTDEGLRSEALREALRGALAGKIEPLENLLVQLGNPTARVNLKLAAAFGAEVSTLSAAVVAVLARLGANDAAPDTPEVFLPIAAAHGWAGRLHAGHDMEAAWAALAGLAADEREPVRAGTLDAFLAITARPGGSDALVAHAASWLETEDPELRFGAAASVMDLLGDARVLSGATDHTGLLDYLSGVISVVADARRSAARSDARRRLLLAMPRALAAVVVRLAGGGAGPRWLEDHCARAGHTEVREVLSQTLIQLRSSPSGLRAPVTEGLRNSLAASAKPLRDPTRLRPGTGRGKSTRRIR